MKNLIKYMLIFSATAVFALSDKVAVVVNDHIITEAELSESALNFAKVSGNMDYLSDPKFNSYIASLLVSYELVKEFSQQNKIDLTEEESANTISGFLQMQGKSENELELVAQDLEISPEWLKMFVLANARQQKIGSYVIAPQIQVSQEEVEQAKSAYLSENSEYQIKAWAVDKDEPGMTVAVVKKIKAEWAATGQDPAEGEVQDLGWKKRSELPAIFLDAISGIEAGNLVGPVQSGYGYHLVWFERERAPEAPSDEAVFQSIFQEKYMVKFNEWLDELPQYHVVIYK